MSRRPWMAFYPADFQLDTLDLSTDEVGMYITMICLAWRHGDGSITGDMQELKIVLQRLHANLHGLTFNRIAPKLLARYFERREDGRYYQRRVEKELRKAEEISEKQKRNANKRWSASNKNNGIAHASAMPSQSQSQSQLHKKEESKNPPTPQRGARRKSRIPIPDAWTKQLPLEAYLDGIQGEVVEREFPRFVASALAHGRQYADWLAAWRNWLSSPYQQSNVLDLRTRKQEESDRVLTALKQSIRRDEEAGEAVCGTAARLLPSPGRE